jgi:predicted metal-dependent enzyme (double-stranded beta helix superfamily)
MPIQDVTRRQSVTEASPLSTIVRNSNTGDIADARHTRRDSNRSERDRSRSRNRVVKEFRDSIMTSLDQSFQGFTGDKSKKASFFLKTALGNEDILRDVKLAPKPNEYVKQTVFQGNHCRGVAIAWGPKAISPDHSHNVECIFGVPKNGPILHEDVFERNSDGTRAKTLKSRYLGGEQMSVEEKGHHVSHQVENQNNSTATTFHVYLAPSEFQEINKVWD